MDDALNKVRELRKEGEAFTYQNFSTKSDYGYPAAFTPEWIAWRARVQSVVSHLAGPDSAPVDLVKAAKQVPVIGNGDDKFSLV